MLSNRLRSICAQRFWQVGVLTLTAYMPKCDRRDKGPTLKLKWSSMCFSDLLTLQLHVFISEQSFPFINPACQLLPAGFASPAQSLHNDDDPLHFNGILMAVPKKRRTVEKRRLRTFGWTKRMEHTQPKTNIVTCPKCGSWHESHTICGMTSVLTLFTY